MQMKMVGALPLAAALPVTAPEVTRIHFVGASHLRRILPDSAAAHQRVEGWMVCEGLLRWVPAR